MELIFEVKGKPLGKQRPRITRKGIAYTPAKTVSYENLIKFTFQSLFPDHTPIEGIVEVNIKAIFDVPTSYSKKKTKDLLENHRLYDKKPDLDNISKIVLDSLNGIAYKDDKQVALLSINKEYGAEPKVIVAIKEVKEDV